MNNQKASQDKDTLANLQDLALTKITNIANENRIVTLNFSIQEIELLLQKTVSIDEYISIINNLNKHLPWNTINQLIKTTIQNHN